MEIKMELENGEFPLVDGKSDFQTEASKQNLTSSSLLSPDYRSKLDDISRLNGFSSLKSFMSDSYLGMNIFNTFTPTILDNSQYGLIFFSRPNMNLHKSNIVKERTLSLLDSQDPNSDAAAIRGYLDPNNLRIGHFSSNKVLVDCPWINLLSNHCVSMTGWPDIVADTYVSQPGLYQQEWVMYDGIPKYYKTWPATFTFNNQDGNPIIHMLNYWSKYGLHAHEGLIDPYAVSMLEEELDYVTRIFVLILDNSRRKIRGIASTFAIPTAIGLGELFNIDRSKVYNDGVNQVSAQMTCIGAEYFDPILYKEFNDITCIFNQGMLPKNRNQSYVKIPHRHVRFFNYQAIPWINIETTELEWYVRRDVYTNIVKMSESYGY